MQFALSDYALTSKGRSSSAVCAQPARNLCAAGVRQSRNLLGAEQQARNLRVTCVGQVGAAGLFCLKVGLGGRCLLAAARDRSGFGTWAGHFCATRGHMR